MAEAKAVLPKHEWPDTALDELSRIDGPFGYNYSTDIRCGSCLFGLPRCFDRLVRRDLGHFGASLKGKRSGVVAEQIRDLQARINEEMKARQAGASADGRKVKTISPCDVLAAYGTVCTTCAKFFVGLPALDDHRRFCK